MGELIGRFIDICLLRAGPQDLPASSVLRSLTLFAYVASGVMILLPSASFGSAVAQALVDTLLLVALLWAVLRWRGLPERFDQALTALAGTGALLGLAALPLVLTVYQADAAGVATPFQSLLLLVLFFWTLAVNGHILRHTLATSYAMGLLLGTVYVVLSLGVLGLFFPHAG